MNKLIHVVTQKKGGIGKSVVAAFLAQYLEEQEGELPLCFDADSNNHSFAKIKGLQVAEVDLVEDGEINSVLFEALLEAAMKDGRTSVIDTGSSTYLPFWSFAKATNLFTLLDEANYSVVLHVPLAAPPNLGDTLEGLSEIAEASPENSIVLWLNEQEDRILSRDQIDTLPEIQEASKKLRGIVLLQRQHYALHRHAVDNMLRDALTFKQATEKSQLFQRSHLRQVREELMEELAIALGDD